MKIIPETKEDKELLIEYHKKLINAPAINFLIGQVMGKNINFNPLQLRKMIYTALNPEVDNELILEAMGLKSESITRSKSVTEVYLTHQLLNL